MCVWHMFVTVVYRSVYSSVHDYDTSKVVATELSASCSSPEPMPYIATGRAALSSEVEMRATQTVSASAQTASTTAS